MTFFNTGKGRVVLVAGSLIVGLMLGAHRSRGTTSVGNLTRASGDLLVKLASMHNATESIRNTLAVVALVVGSTIALGTYLWNRRQKRTENTISVVEREMYEKDFQAATDLLESALHNPRFSNTTPFMLPREYRNAFLLALSHYTAVIARAKASLLNEQLYRKLLDFRLDRNLKLLQPYIKAVQNINGDDQWGAEILDLLRVETHAPSNSAGWILSQQYMIRNMSPETMVSYLENQTAQRFGHRDAFAVSGWFASEWTGATREARIRWVSGRKEQMREEILSFQLAGLSWPDLTRAMERLDDDPGPALAGILADSEPPKCVGDEPAEFTLA
jgi:hypothetical protein